MSANNKMRKGWVPVALTVAVACALTACKKDDQAAAGTQAAQQAAPAPTPETVVAASVSAMGVDQLRDAANTAYNDNRLYAPAGNNAMEYYLALRDKQPGDAGASSALSDLLPMTVIATEQSIAREDFEEASRLLALIGKADPNHPALSRLKATVGSGEAKLKQQATNNTKEQFANSPDLKTELLNAIMGALDAHTLMSTQALNSATVRGGLKDILPNHARLYETLRAQTERPVQA